MHLYMEFSVWVGGDPEILMYSLLQIGRSYRERERADPPMLLLADFMCLEDLCSTQRRVVWVRFVEKHRVLP